MFLRVVFHGEGDGENAIATINGREVIFTTDMPQVDIKLSLAPSVNLQKPPLAAYSPSEDLYGRDAFNQPPQT